jgi:hypothetical protein
VPTVDEAAALMVGDGYEAIDRHEVILAQQAGSFQRISELHVGYMVLHCRNPNSVKCGGEAQHLEKWGFGVLRDSRMFRAGHQGAKHLSLGCS